MMRVDGGGSQRGARPGIPGALLAAWRRRRLRKRAREVLHHARHVRAMREDVASTEDLEAAAELERHVEAAARRGDVAAFGAETRRLDEALARIAPPSKWPRVREFVELVAVAGSVAMGLRCYFVQPFRIPTGSMQPTMFGVQVAEQSRRRWWDLPPLSLAGWALFGEGYVEVRARCNGYVGMPVPSSDGDYLLLPVRERPAAPGDRDGGVLHRVRARLPLRVTLNEFVTAGQVLASGRVTIGDHVFVDKIRYNFFKPRRGDIIVFDTTAIDYPDLRGDFYIKRLAGLPNEQISIRPPHLVADDRTVESPEPFRRLVHDPRYHGYQLAGGAAHRRPVLAEPGDVLQLGPDEFLPLGDNTRSSLDGRYFGPIHRSALVGPAFMIYWPLSRRWGPVR